MSVNEPIESRVPRRILFVDHTPFVGGAELALVHHVRALDRSRFRPLVACTDAVPSLVEMYRAAGAEVHIVALPRLRSFHPRSVLRALRAARALRALVRRLDVDLVVANTSRAAYVATAALMGARVPLVWWLRDFLFGRRLFRACHRTAARIFCVSDDIRRFYGGAADSRFCVIYVGSGMDEQLARLSAWEVRAERERWGFASDDIVIGFMGRLVEEKGAEDLIVAMSALNARDARLKLLLVGTGAGQERDVETRLRDLVRERAWTFARFAGYQTDEAMYYSVFDIFVLATRSAEPYPTSVVQAMLARRAVVATATGGTPELVRDRETGMLVPPSSPACMADAIGQLVANPELRRHMIATARESVMRDNREIVTTKQAERQYDEVIAASGN